MMLLCQTRDALIFTSSSPVSSKIPDDTFQTTVQHSETGVLM